MRANILISTNHDFIPSLLSAEAGCYIKQAGPIHAVHWVTKGKAVVVYKKKSSASKAAELNETTIDGNARW